MKIIKSLLICLLLIVAGLAHAGTVTLTWSAASDPAVGWNLYYNHLQTPDALQYIGTTNADQRSTVLHNISATGVYQFGISRVEHVWDGSSYRRVEGPVTVVTFLDGTLITTPDGTTITSATFDPE